MAAILETIVSEGTETDVEAAGSEVGTVGIGDASEFVDACYEGTDKGEVDEGDKEGGVACAEICYNSCDGPYCCQY